MVVIPMSLEQGKYDKTKCLPVVSEIRKPKVVIPRPDHLAREVQGKRTELLEILGETENLLEQIESP